MWHAEGVGELSEDVCGFVSPPHISQERDGDFAGAIAKGCVFSELCDDGRLFTLELCFERFFASLF